MLHRALVFAFLAAGGAAVGCGGKYPASTTPTTAGGAGPGGMGQGDNGMKLPKGGIAAAGLPYQVLDGRTGRQLDEPAFWAALTASRAVCVGEEHPNPHHHWAQLHIVQQLLAKLPPGTKVALGLEMIQRPFQGVVDDYVAKRIDAAALQSRAGWEARWGYDWALYGPTIDAAIAGGGTVLALNTSRELTKKVSRQGLASLTPEEKAQVPELVLDDAKHRAWFDGIMGDMGGHGHGHAAPAAPTTDAAPEAEAPAAPSGGPPMPSADRIYTVQVLWDETMADGGARWLAANPTGHLIVLAGNGHCHDTAIVGRMIRRGIASAISVAPVIDVEDNVASLLAKPMHDYALVLQLPKR